MYSIGGRENPLESEGIFVQFANLGIDEGGMVIELGSSHDALKGTQRIIPIHAILAIDILDVKTHEKTEEDKDPSHYYS